LKSSAQEFPANRVQTDRFGYRSLNDPRLDFYLLEHFSEQEATRNFDVCWG